jgi:hypothetical protein
MTVAYAEPVSEARRISFARTRAAAMLVFRFILGVLFCQTLAGSLVAVGWTYRWMQRRALQVWWRTSGLETSGGTFKAFAAADAATVAHVYPPKWFVRQTRIVQTDRGALGEFFARWFGSFWLNLRTGFAAVSNTLVVTGPAAALWMFSWYAGWDNSFNKGYEQAPIGPITGFSGVGLFILAMLYVPMAQARHAVTGEWRAFYQFRLNLRLMRICWLQMLLLAGVYTLVSVPVHAFRVFPYFLHVANEDFAEMSAAEQIELMNGYYFWTTAVLLALFIVVRLAVARIYAAGVLRGLKSGRIDPSELSELERHALERLGLADQSATPKRHAFVRAVLGGGTWLARSSAMLALLVVWFMFTAQIFVAQFVNYQPGRAWVNQPLVHAPWLKFIPGHLEDAAELE